MTMVGNGHPCFHGHIREYGRLRVELHILEWSGKNLVLRPFARLTAVSVVLHLVVRFQS